MLQSHHAVQQPATSGLRQSGGGRIGLLFTALEVQALAIQELLR